MGFLDNYEDVASRIVRFWETHPSGRIDTNIIDFNADKGYIFVQCQVFREYEDEKPSATDYAFGNVATYNVQMKKFFAEDTVTSAIGRAIGLLLGVDKRPTRQDMEKVETIDVKVVASTADDYDPWANSLAVKASIDNIAAQLGGELIPQAPQCEHGHRVWREGEKNGKAWGGYMCVEKSKAAQCPPVWYVLDASGSWKPQS
jgi:hypothetical protein